MKRVRRRDTSAEILLRRVLHARGLRYFVDKAPIKGMRSRADLVFPRARVAVFVDGCFWHACPLHATKPKSNHEWWETKLRANVERDRRTDAALAAANWAVLRVWEHEPVDTAADRVQSALAGRLTSSPG
jgi:DNA mismatch endonuclease (patch repair protein)